MKPKEILFVKILIFNISGAYLDANKVGMKKQLLAEVPAEAQGAYAQLKSRCSTS